MASADKKAITSLSFGHFMADLYSSAMVPLYPYIAGKLSISISIISTIIGFAHFLSSSLQPLFGYLADKTRHRFFMFWGLVIGGIFIPLAVFSQNVWLLGFFLMFAIMGNAMFHPQTTAMINIFNKNNPSLNKYLGIFLAVGIAGYSMGPVFSSNLLEHFGQESLWSIAILGVISAVLLYFTVPKIPTNEIALIDIKFLETLKSIIKNKALMALLLISITKSVVSLSFSTYVPFLLKDMGYSVNQIGFVLTIFFFMSGLASIISYAIEKIIGAKNVIKYSFYSILPLTLILLLTLRQNVYFSLFIFAILGFCTFLSTSINLVLAQKIMPNNKAVVSGMVGGFSWAIAALCLMPLGIIVQFTNVQTAFIIVSVLALLVGIFGINKDLNCILLKYRNL